MRNNCQLPHSVQLQFMFPIVIDISNCNWSFLLELMFPTVICTFNFVFPPVTPTTVHVAHYIPWYSHKVTSGTCATSACWMFCIYFYLHCHSYANLSRSIYIIHQYSILSHFPRGFGIASLFTLPQSLCLACTRLLPQRLSNRRVNTDQIASAGEF